MIEGENKLTKEIKNQLQQGTKVEFKWHGNNSLLYTGYIEIDKWGELYFCAEHNYKDGELTDVGKSMQYYNTLESFFFFTYFEILENFYKGYRVDREGYIISKRFNRPLKYNILQKGYAANKLRVDGKYEDVLVHRIIAKMFVPNPENKPQVNHKDGNKLNNCYDNLEWCTASENQIHAIENNLASIGEDKPQSKLTEGEAIEIKYSSMSQRKLAKKYNISRSVVADIKSKRRWKHI